MAEAGAVERSSGRAARACAATADKYAGDAKLGVTRGYLAAASRASIADKYRIEVEGHVGPLL